MPEWFKIIFPSLTAILAAYLSARWAVRRTYEEKWWEKREKAYGEIIDALHDIVRYMDMAAEESMKMNEREHPKKKEFESDYTEAYWHVQKATDVGAFVISEDCAAVLKKLRERPRLKWDENPPWEVYEEDARHYRTALADVRACAKKDLGV